MKHAIGGFLWGIIVGCIIGWFTLVHQIMAGYCRADTNGVQCEFNTANRPGDVK